MKTTISKFLSALESRLMFADKRTVRALTKMIEDPDKVADQIVKDYGSDTQPLHVGPPKRTNPHDISGND